MRFAPRPVPARNAWAWLREALALSVRAPSGFAGIVLLHAALYALPDPLGVMAFASVPLLLGAGVALAARVDGAKAGTEAGAHAGTASTSITRVACLRLLIAGAVVAAVALLAVQALDAPDATPPDTAAWPGPLAPANAVNDALGLAARGLWFWSLVLGPTVWFVVPLAILAGLPLAAAAVQSTNGFLLNRFLVLVWAVAVGAIWVATLVPVLIVPCTALYSCVLYTGYRDVWLGRGDNVPRAVRATIRNETASAARPTSRSHDLPVPFGACE